FGLIGRQGADIVLDYRSASVFPLLSVVVSGPADQPVQPPVPGTGPGEGRSKPWQALFQLFPQGPGWVDQHQPRPVEPEPGVDRSHMQFDAQYLGYLGLGDAAIEITQQALVLDRVPESNHGLAHAADGLLHAKIG